MRKPANSNIYSYAADAAHELYAPFLNGAADGRVCVVCAQPASSAVAIALESSFRKLGYGDDPCLYISLAENAGEEPFLEGQALLSLIEAFDPRVLVAADATAANILASAYRHPVDVDTCTRLFGRTCIAFASFEGMLADSAAKQRAWALLKKVDLS